MMRGVHDARSHGCAAAGHRGASRDARQGYVRAPRGGADNAREGRRARHARQRRGVGEGQPAARQAAAGAPPDRGRRADPVPLPGQAAGAAAVLGGCRSGRRPRTRDNAPRARSRPTARPPPTKAAPAKDAKAPAPKAAAVTPGKAAVEAPAKKAPPAAPKATAPVQAKPKDAACQIRGRRRRPSPSRRRRRWMTPTSRRRPIPARTRSACRIPIEARSSCAGSMGWHRAAVWCRSAPNWSLRPGLPPGTQRLRHP